MLEATSYSIIIAILGRYFKITTPAKINSTIDIASKSSFIVELSNRSQFRNPIIIVYLKNTTKASALMNLFANCSVVNTKLNSIYSVSTLPRI